MGEALLSRRRGRAPWAALGLLLATATAGPAAAQSVLEPEEPPAAEAAAGAPAVESGPVVTAVEIRSEAPLGEDPDPASLLDVAVGEPLTGLRLRRTLRNFQAAGVAPQVEVYTRPDAAGAGVVAIVVLHPAIQVEEVRVEGDFGLSREQLADAVEQKEAQALAEDRVLRSVYRLQDLYAENGYFEARVRPRVEVDEARRRATVVFEVASGPRATVGTVAFDGATAPFTPAQLVERLRLKPGQAYRKQTAEEDAERLQGWLVRQRHNLADVDPPREEILREESRVNLTYPLEVGPRLEVRIVGAEEKRLRRRGLLPFLGEEGYDEALVLQSLAKIKDYYQQQGHYHAEVGSAEERADGVLRLTITIEPGPQYTLAEVEFEGNQTFSDEHLSELLATSERRLLALGSGRLVQSELDADLDNLRSYYALQGFAEAEVGTPEVYESGEALRLVIPIDEGPRQTVGSLFFIGLADLELDAVRRRIPLTDGGPFHPVLLEEALDSIRAAFAEDAYDEAQVSAAQAWNPDRSVVDLTIEAIPGPQAVAARVIVRGNQRTEAEVIRRTVGIERGEPVSTTKLLEVERSLYRLGIFSFVDVQRTRPGLAATSRDVIVRVEEGLPRTVTYGVGYDSEDGARGLLGFTHNNVGGRAYSLITDLRISQRDQRARVIFDQPYVGKYPVPLTSTLFYLNEDDDEAGVETLKWGGRTEASKLLGRTRYGLALDYRVVEANLDQGRALNDVERENRPIQIASTVPSVFLDRRDDPVLPSRGWSSLVQTQYAFPVLGAEAELLKAFLQHTQYFRLGGAGVIATSARVGGIEPYQTLGSDDPDLPEDLPNADVFISERFFLGGSTTHRAYARDRLGMLGETLFPRDPDLPLENIRPVGGNGMLLLNLEYRFPILGPVGGAVFYDLGNVWADWRHIDFGQLKGGAGVGLRYLSPIGPLRVEAGWKLDREEFEDSTPVVFLSFGNPF